MASDETAAPRFRAQAPRWRDGKRPATVWAERRRHRRNCLHFLVASADFHAVDWSIWMGIVRPDEVPPLPNPEDPSISTRQWETSVQDWRRAMRRLAARRLPRRVQWQ